jgi:hypothetical protein
MQVYVLLFNTGTNNEGIHTLKITSSEDGTTQDVVLAFAEEEDATRFALLLEAQDFPSPSVESIEEEELEEFCLGAGLHMERVENGMLAVPPEVNLDEMDWQADGATPEGPSLDQIRRQLEKLL